MCDRLKLKKRVSLDCFDERRVSRLKRDARRFAARCFATTRIQTRNLDEQK
jgi:hypothetical protein